MVSLDDVRAARARIGHRIHQTPLMSSATLAAQIGAARAALKCENFQKTGSFKVRGSLNLLSQLSPEARSRGVVSVSAGNHAQALAWGAGAEGIACTVCMPQAATQAKVDASRGYGATVIQHGTSADAFALALKMAEEQGLTFVPPFDDDRIIAGAATGGIEMLEQIGDAPDLVVVPIGGGGLISGIALGVKESSSRTRVIGVEPRGAAVMRMSLDAGHAMRISQMSTIADGLAAPMAGERNFEIVRRYVDDVVLVEDEEIKHAMRFLLERCKLLAEPAGAAATAALLSGRIPVKPGERVVSWLSGGNVDLGRLKEIL